MKKIILLIFISFNSFAAARYCVSGGNGNWSSTTNWSATSGGASGASVPTVSDDITFDTHSGAMTVDVASSCNSVIAYNNTITFAANLTVTTFFNCGASLSLNGSSYSLLVGGDFYQGTFNVGGSLGNITMNGTGTWYNAGNNPLQVPIIFNTSGTITISSYAYSRSAITYISGTIFTTGSILKSDDYLTLNTNGMIWATITQVSGSIITLTSNISCVNLNSYGQFNGAYTLSVSGNFANTSASGNTSGIILTGTGTWSGSGFIQVPLTINTSGTITYNGTNTTTSSITYVSGTVTTTGSTLFTRDCTLNTNGITWNNITFTGGNVTLSSNLTVNGTMTFNQANQATTYFLSTGVWTCNTLYCVTSGVVINLLTGQTYTCTNSCTITGTSGSPIIMKSSTTTKAKFNLQSGATQNINYCNGQYIDSSGGQTIYSIKGVLTSTINWLTALPSNTFFLMFN